ncbi:MAG: hypothetical protein KatS3mg087_1813 [Patescibacteria group bacterium]|nr:MAG: hypothetical protein KatS3mg087_1813 [Patescibacteria group bacterium]
MDRLIQAAGDIGARQEPRAEDLFSVPQISGSSKTGDQAFSVAPGDNVGGRSATAIVTMRAGFYIRVNQSYIILSMYLFSAYEYDPVSQSYTERYRYRYDDGMKRMVFEESDGVGGFNIIAESHRIDEASLALYKWHHLGFYMNTSDGVFKVYKNGELSTSLSGLTFNYDIHAVYFGETGRSVDIDDLYIDYSSISEIESMPEAIRFYPLHPQANGSIIEMSPEPGSNQNYDNVNDDGSPDWESTYVWCGPGTFTDLYQFGVPPIEETEQADAAIVQILIEDYEDPINTQARGVVSDGINTLYGTYVLAEPNEEYSGLSNGRWVVAQSRFESQPDGSSWDTSGFSGNEFGFQVSAV